MVSSEAARPILPYIVNGRKIKMSINQSVNPDFYSGLSSNTTVPLGPQEKVS